IGKRIRRTMANSQWTTVIGIVRHVKHSELAEDSDRGVHYYPNYQTLQLTTFAVLARTTLDPLPLSASIRDAVRATDPAQPVFDLQPMDDRILASLGSQRFAARLMVVFAAVAVFMSTIGLYGVVSYIVAQRSHEIGVRLALGASNKQILALVVGHGMRMTGAGVVLGSIGAFVLAKLVASQLFQVRVFEPITLAFTGVIIAVIALLACMIPAARAMSVDPLDACRYD